MTIEGFHKISYVAILDCRHEIRYSVGEPTPGDTVFCTKCYDYKRILHNAERFGATCQHCRYARSGGKIGIITFAEKHSRKYRLHVIDVYGPGDFHMEVRQQASLLDVVECPF